MMCRRKITAFSAALSAFTIDHGESESSGPDLLVSFHDNDHYNSVRDEKVPPKAPAKRKATKSKLKADKSEEDGKKADMSGEDGEKVEKVEKAEEDGKNAELSEKQDTSTTTSMSSSMSDLSVTDMDKPNAKAAKPPKKNAPCPCGSGKRYKKCCLARQKHAGRVEKMKEEAAKNGDRSMEENKSAEDQEVTMKGNFRVLQI
jgi:hypothetical protein